ncbi:hypothetical protein L7F22_055456 [Adiantum nelumboides]|nr:hypothetical protein [Adiantum nelumboides]
MSAQREVLASIFCIIMADLCTKVLQVVKRCHKASSRGKFWVVEEKLDDLECLLEDALEYIYEYKGRKLKSCSTKKGIKCLHLREKFEEEFGFDESSDDEDDEWEYLMGVSKSQGKGVQVGGVSQRSHQEPIDTPKPTLEIPPNGNILHHTHPNNQHDDENMCESNVFASDGLNFENSASHTSSQAAMELLELNNGAQMDFSSLLQSQSSVLHSFQTTADYSKMVDEGFYDEAHGIDIVQMQVHSKRKACLNKDEIIAVRKYEAQAKREYKKQCHARKQVQPSINVGA